MTLWYGGYTALIYARTSVKKFPCSTSLKYATLFLHITSSQVSSHTTHSFLPHGTAAGEAVTYTSLDLASCLGQTPIEATDSSWGQFPEWTGKVEPHIWPVH